MIIRHKHAGRFTAVPNAIFEDTRLSVEAKGFLGYLLSRPPNWQTRQDHLQRTLSIGRKLLRRCRDELVEAGYIDCDTRQGRDDLNRFTALNYIVRDIPTAADPSGPKPPRPSPLRQRSSDINKEEIKKEPNNTLPKPLSPEIQASGLASQVIYTEIGQHALMAGNHPVYVGSKPYNAWLSFRGADGMPGLVDRIHFNGRVQEVVWMPSMYPPKRSSREDDEDGRW
jgi:hypothetical protein